MFQRLMERRKDERGFTLIELMVVVLVIGILIAIALPTFLGARERAQDRAAQSNLRNGMAAAKVYFSDNDTYVKSTTDEFDAAAGSALEPSLTWADIAAAPAVGTVGIVSTETSSTSILLVAQSQSGKFFCIADQSNTVGTTYLTGSAYGDVNTVALCDGTAF